MPIGETGLCSLHGPFTGPRCPTCKLTAMATTKARLGGRWWAVARPCGSLFLVDGPPSAEWIAPHFEVMLVAEHKNAVAVKRQAFEVAEGGRKLWMARALIFEDALQRIADTDPDALDALRIASKALGDATEYENTGRVAFESPLARLNLPESEASS